MRNGLALLAAWTMAAVVGMLGIGYAQSPVPDAKSLVSAAKGVKEIVAHRGASAKRPENTLAAYLQAMDDGATAIEVDVRQALDGPLVSVHDDTLERTTTGEGRVENRTLAQLKALDAGSWFSAEWKDERIPTLREICEIANGRTDVFLDLKDGDERYRLRVVQEIRRHGDPRRTILGVRSTEAARFFRQYLSESRQVGLIPSPLDVELFTAEGVKLIRLWPKWLVKEGDTAAGDKLIQRVREAGAGILISAGKGGVDETKLALRARPEMLFTDDPEALLETLEALKKLDSDEE